MDESNKKIELLKEIAQKFNESNITWALGHQCCFILKKLHQLFMILI